MSPIAEWASLNLYDAAMAIRMGRDGSADPLDPDREAEIVAVLRQRLAEWRPSIWPRRERSDALLRELIASILDE